MHHPDTTALDPYLRFLWDHHATDLHLCAGTEPRARIDGRLVSVPGAAALSTELLDPSKRPEALELGRTTGVAAADAVAAVLAGARR